MIGPLRRLSEEIGRFSQLRDPWQRTAVRRVAYSRIESVVAKTSHVANRSITDTNVGFHGSLTFCVVESPQEAVICTLEIVYRVMTSTKFSAVKVGLR